MNDEMVMKQIISLFSFLKNHVELNTKNSFSDIGFSLETLFMDILNEVDEGGGWINSNTIKYDYPAIDLQNNVKGEAIQITTTADKKKFDNTMIQYKKQGLKFSSVVIVGFLKNTKHDNGYFRTESTKYIVSKIYGSSFEVKEEVLKILHKQIPLQKLNPLSDSDCLEILYNFVNRSAIRDNMFCEGSYDDMVKGLKDVKSLIASGQIDNIAIRTKPLSAYPEPLQSKISEIEYNISSIIQICNKARQGEFVMLNYPDKMEIDRIKEVIIDDFNNILKNCDIDKKIRF